MSLPRITTYARVRATELLFGSKRPTHSDDGDKVRVLLRILCLTTVGLALPARAQDIASLQQGVRIRVEPATGGKKTGTYLGVASDTLRS